ncbi:MAG: hypothetical protein K8H88_06350 [Sandaracinaceae bacterium]|nr:hypothetical protein [Sandaracinaceae bacterium]
MRTPYGEDRAAQAFVAEHPDGATLEQVGLALGVTRERVRQIELDALRHFRQRARVAGLPLEVVDLLARRAS